MIYDNISDDYQFSYATGITQIWQASSLDISYF